MLSYIAFYMCIAMLMIILAFFAYYYYYCVLCEINYYSPDMIYLLAFGVLTVAKFLCFAQKCYLINLFLFNQLIDLYFFVACLQIEYFT